jgi:prolyl-tRNA synthetase
LGLKYSDDNGQSHYAYMGCYGIGPSRIVGAIAEHFADDKGLVWPESVAPAQVYLINIESDDSVVKITTDVYERLHSQGVEVLWDDRLVRAGEKFADADLMGIPWRVVVSQKLGHQLEVKSRTSDQPEIVSFEELLNIVKPH